MLDFEGARMTDTSADIGIDPNERTILGHPRGLVILFFTEMWERFSYYGMRGLLILYLTQHFLFSDERSSLIYGAYVSLVYVMAIFGGALADRYLGQKKAVTFGAILLVCGHFLMAFEGGGSKETLEFSDGQPSLEISDEGRGNKRQLFVDYDGEPRRLVFDSETYAIMSGMGENGSDLRMTPMNDEGVGDFAVTRQSRSVVQNVCNFLNMECKGPEPKTTLNLASGVTYEIISETNEAGDTTEYAMVDGQRLAFAEHTDTDLQILAADSRNKDPLNTDPAKADKGDKDPATTVYKTVADGGYSTSVVQEQFFVNLLYLSLALIIAGVGFLKANISTIVGDLYKLGDKRRDSGFTLFYMGINLGAFLSSWTCGILGIVYGWKYGFGLAGIGMALGLFVFLRYQHWLDGKADAPDLDKLKEKVFGPINVEWACYLSALLIIGVSIALVMNPEPASLLMAGIGVLMFVVLIGYSFIKLRGKERSRMWAAVYFALAQIPFWSLFEQAGSSLNLFTDRLVNIKMMGWDVPAPVFQSLNAGFIIIFAPLIAWMWVVMAKRKIEPSTPVKFAIGVFGVGLGFLALVAGMKTTGASALTPVIFIFLIYWIHTMAELMLSPVGLSAMTKLAPARAGGLIMGTWFLYTGLSNSLAGVIAKSTGAETIGGQIINVAAAKATYASVYTSVAYVAMAVAVLMLLISPLISYWMKQAD